MPRGKLKKYYYNAQYAAETARERQRECARESDMEEGCTLIESIGACCKNVNQTAKQLQLEMFNNGAIKWRNGGMKNK